MRAFRREENLLNTLGEWVAQYGDAIRFRFFLRFYGYFFCHPEHNQHILLENNRNYTKMPNPSNQVLTPLVGNGLLTSDGDFWLRQRRLAQPAFHRRQIESFAQTMTAATEGLLARWQEPSWRQEALDITEAMMELTLEIAGRTLFSIDLAREAETVGEAFLAANRQVIEFSARPFGAYLITLPWWPSTRRLNEDIAVLDEVVNGIIDRRRRSRAVQEEREPADLLDILMQARDEETGEGMSDKQLRDEVMTIILAGHETTALALSWTFYLLSEHPAIRQRLENEVDVVLNGRTPTFADIPDLTYTRMVIEEAMRLYPPAYAIARWGNEWDKVGGYDIPAGSAITLSPYFTHRHPDFWEEPERFDPERFTPERKAARSRWAYIPFGGGPRQCIGNRFAMTEAILILAQMSSHYRLHLVPGHPVALEPLITLRPRFGLQMTPVRRSSR
jgi:cytochrome P450